MIENQSAKSGIEIQVAKLTKSKTFTKTVSFTITGSDSVGSFLTERTYKEFKSLRKILLIQWPGFCIPQIPPSKIIVNKK